MLALCKYMAELVDEDGYLTQEDLDGLTEMKIPPDDGRSGTGYDSVLGACRRGRRDLSECLVLQLSRRKDNVPYAMDIAARFLTELSRSHYGPTPRHLGPASLKFRRRRSHRCLGSSPRSGVSAGRADPLRPAGRVRGGAGRGIAGAAERILSSKGHVNPYYSSMAKESDDPETRTYLREKLRQTNGCWTAWNAGQHLRRCAQAILDAQRSFFSGQTVELSPMKLSSLAETLDLHPSTVSRAVRDKYLQCRQGIYPLRYFFSRAVGQQGLSRQAVKQRMLLRFKDEDSGHPLSDQTLCDLLAAEGIFLAAAPWQNTGSSWESVLYGRARARNRGK